MKTTGRIHLATAAYQAAESQDQGPTVVIGLVIVFGLMAFTVGLTRHIRMLWNLAQAFLGPMRESVKLLATVVLVIIVVLFGLSRAGHHDSAAAPAATVPRAMAAPVTRATQ